MAKHMFLVRRLAASFVPDVGDEGGALRTSARRCSLVRWRVGSVLDPAEAVKLADQYGICRTAKALRVGYYALKERVETEAAALASASPAVNEATFLELAVPSRAGAGECVLEWEDAAGGKMRVHLKGLEAPDLVALSRSFWEARR